MEGGAAVTAEERYRHLLGAFRAAEPAEINTLLAAPEQLGLASDYVHAVVDDLDERRPVAATGCTACSAPPCSPSWWDGPNDAKTSRRTYLAVVMPGHSTSIGLDIFRS
jgi:hypothetical protein